MRAVTYGLVVLAASIATGSALAGERVARRSAELGMTLAQMVRLPHPDKEKAQLVCSSHMDRRSKYAKYFKGYELREIALSPEWVDRGLDKCVYARKDSFTGDWTSSGVMLNGLPVVTDYMFFPDAAGMKRLILINTGAPAGLFAVLVNAHLNQYGPITRQENTTVQNGLGNTFPATNYLWRVGPDDILIKQYSDSLEKMVIHYLERDAYQSFLVEQQKFLAANQQPM